VQNMVLGSSTSSGHTKRKKSEAGARKVGSSWLTREVNFSTLDDMRSFSVVVQLPPVKAPPTRVQHQISVRMA
jgi:hypothetical protein